MEGLYGKVRRGASGEKSDDGEEAKVEEVGVAVGPPTGSLFG